MRYLPVFAEWLAWSGRLLVNHLWQATLFSGIAMLASLLLKGAPARARYLIWLAAALKFAVPSTIVFVVLSSVGLDPQPYLTRSPETLPTLHYIAPIVSPVVVPAGYLEPSANELRAAPPETSVNQTLSLRSLSLIVALVWLFGSITLLYSWIKKRRRIVLAMKHGMTCHSGRERTALTNVMSWLKIRRQVGLVITSEVKEPGVWGVIQPTILLPEEISQQLTEDELESLMMHELAHVLRWDNLVSNLHMILCCLFWFNPIVWLIDRCLLKEREEACDELVLRLCGTGEVYASSITKIYRFCLSSRLSGLSAAGGSSLKRRLERILDHNPADNFRFAQKMLVLLVGFGCVIFSVVAGLPNVEKVAARSELTFQQMAAKLEAPLASTTTAKICADPNQRRCAPNAGMATISEGQIATVMVRPELGAETEEGSAQPPNTNALTARQVAQPITTREEPPQAFESAHAIDFKKFAGRYGVNPSVMENFIFDVFVQDNELWLKPSYTNARRLVAVSSVEYVDSKSSGTRVTFNFDPTGNVDSFTLKGWGPTIKVQKLILPPPSTQGNITFRLAGFANARHVAVAGTFNNWNQSQYFFEQVGNDWICRINLPPGKYQYKFIVDGNWLVDPVNPTIEHDDRGFENSVLIAR